MKTVQFFFCMMGLFLVGNLYAQKAPHAEHKIVGEWTATSPITNSQMTYVFSKGGAMKVSDPSTAKPVKGKWKYDNSTMLLTTTMNGATTWTLKSVDNQTLTLQYNANSTNVVFTRKAKK